MTYDDATLQDALLALCIVLSILLLIAMGAAFEFQRKRADAESENALLREQNGQDSKGARQGKSGNA